MPVSKCLRLSFEERFFANVPLPDPAVPSIAIIIKLRANQFCAQFIHNIKEIWETGIYSRWSENLYRVI